MMVAEVVPFDCNGMGGSWAFRVNPGRDSTYMTEVRFDGGGILAQPVHLVEGIAYSVSVSTAMETLLPLPNNEGGAIELSIDGQMLWRRQVGYMEGHTVKRESFVGEYVPVRTGAHDLAISCTRTFGNHPTPPTWPTPRIYHYIDNVSVVPEPGAAGLLVVAAVWRLWRRRAEAV